MRDSNLEVTSVAQGPDFHSSEAISHPRSAVPWDSPKILKKVARRDRSSLRRHALYLPELLDYTSHFTHTNFGLRFEPAGGMRTVPNDGRMIPVRFLQILGVALQTVGLATVTLGQSIA
ncbi:hypothetical protein PoB_004269200 [Plakobranchus ocellatus]|uniref:Uncharacterized protein n=1 Tax=Plakobranchus ocellatus TaxID=259542 RepID=A0AAV4BAL7_9GAST|nr:hypothetical protein PoB_004269200 [Plakobranchus ocellatus]